VTKANTGTEAGIPSDIGTRRGREAEPGREGRRRVWLVDDVRFDAHASRGYHPERPERLVAARSAVGKVDTAWERVPLREATADELARVHAPAFVDALENLRGRDEHIDPDTFVVPSSVAAARLGAGGLVEMVDRMIDTDDPRGVAIVRPPGHHARPSRAMGFCLLNGVAIAAAHARARGMARVAIVDFDVHHGNGTQEMFYGDPSVLYASLHQFPFYPGTGTLDEVGVGDGTGYTVNVPLAAGANDAIYAAAFEQVIVPVLDAYAPELVLVSAGFDAAARDPLGQMQLTTDAFGFMTHALASIADKHARGRLGLVLEGGYDLVALEEGLASSMRAALFGEAPKIEAWRGHPEIARAEAVARRVWPLPR
jgi:acetoin utilization deacetylase AcuC-like enzyme